MAVTISAELLDFKSKIASEISNMKTTSDSLKDKIMSATDLATSTKNSISSVYYSKNKDEILSKFDKINTTYSKINSSITSFLDVALEKASKLLEKIDKLEELQKNIEEQENKIKNAGSAWSYDYDSHGKITNKSEVDSHNREREITINEANSQLNILIPQFNELHEQSKSELNNLKSLDSSLSFVSEFSSTDISNYSQYLSGSSFEQFNFKASNGVSLSYYLYVPNYSVDVEKLPVHLYLHGSGEGGDGVLRTGLPKMLKDGLNTNGIVICPQSSSGYWTNNDLEDALIELTNEVVEKYSGDSEKISLSGHSAGAIGGYKIISRNPNYFSAFIPISGNASRVATDDINSLESLSNVKIWAFHGKNDESISYNSAVDAINQIETLGKNNADLYTFDAGHSGVQNTTFANTYSYRGEEPINPLIWAFKQKKES